jgi:hypothetical protein
VGSERPPFGRKDSFANQRPPIREKGADDQGGLIGDVTFTSLKTIPENVEFRPGQCAFSNARLRPVAFELKAAL